jgi:hypothetical protein
MGSVIQTTCHDFPTSLYARQNLYRKCLASAVDIIHRRHNSLARAINMGDPFDYQCLCFKNEKNKCNGASFLLFFPPGIYTACRDLKN